MAIAGVKPVDVEVFNVNEDQIEAVITGKGVDETTELYTHDQVRDILIKFSIRVEAVDEFEPPFVPNVDEFMNHN